MQGNKSTFQTLSEVDISSKIEKKLVSKKHGTYASYLSWSNAWAYVKAIYPLATYSVSRSATNPDLNYFTDGKTCWVETSVTIENETQLESLPVINSYNQCIPLESVTAMDVNTAIKRCLVKNLALFGLGLSLWNGEDLSDILKSKLADELAELKPLVNEIIAIGKKAKESGGDVDAVYSVIEKHNNGSRSLNAIANVEVATKILEELKGVQHGA